MSSKFRVRFLDNKNRSIPSDEFNVFNIRGTTKIVLENLECKDYYFQINTFDPKKILFYDSMHLNDEIKHSGEYIIKFYAAAPLENIKYHDCTKCLCLSDDGLSNYCSNHGKVEGIGPTFLYKKYIPDVIETISLHINLA